MHPLSLLEKLPTELLRQIGKEIIADGPHHLLDLTRVSRTLHDVSNQVLYENDVKTTRGLRSMLYGLKAGLNSVVKFCLSATADPNLRIESRKILDGIFPPCGATEDSTEASPHLDNGEDTLQFAIDKYRRNQVVGSEVVYDSPFVSDGEFYWTPLHVAATRGDIELLDLLLKTDKINPNSAGRGVCICQHLPLRRTFNGQRNDLERRLMTRWSPLHVALCKGNFEWAEEFIRRLKMHRAVESDETVVETDEMVIEQARLFREQEGRGSRFTDLEIDKLVPRLDPLPPLHVAAANFASVETLEEVYNLLERTGCLEGPSSGIDLPDAFGDTPFATSAFTNRFPVVSTWFINRGADINCTIRDSDGKLRSVFNAVCDSGLYGNALLLMDMGINIHKDMELNSGNRHESALNLCCGSYASVAPRNRNDENRPEALELISRLIHAGADLNFKGKDGMTALISAVATGFVAAVRKLLESKADVGAEDDDSWSALHWAAHRGMQECRVSSAPLEIMRILLDHGADPNQRSGAVNFGPPLFSDCYACDDADTRQQSNCWAQRAEFDLPPPTFFDRERGRSSMVSIAELLIHRGADPNIFHEDPRDLVQVSLEQQLGRLHEKSLVVTGFFLGQFDAVDALLRLGAVVTFQEYILMMRSLIDRGLRSWGIKTDVVECLFRIRESPSLKLEDSGDRDRIMDAWTELFHYAVAARPKLIPVLAPHVALTGKCGPSSKTVLHILAEWRRKRREKNDDFNRRVNEVMFGLLGCGAGRFVDQPDSSGRSPLRVAIERGNFCVAKALVQSGASIQFEHREDDQSKPGSALRPVFQGHASTSQFEEAVRMLERCGYNCGPKRLYRQSEKFLNDVQYVKRDFADKASDQSTRTVPMTTRLIRHMINLGSDADASYEEGSTALRLLSRVLLCSSSEGPADGGLEDIEFFRTSHDNADPGSNFASVLLSLPATGMDGVNVSYMSDSDWGTNVSDDDDIGVNGNIELDDNFDLEDDGDTNSDVDTEGSF